MSIPSIMPENGGSYFEGLLPGCLRLSVPLREDIIQLGTVDFANMGAFKEFMQKVGFYASERQTELNYIAALNDPQRPLPALPR
jgi:hypothetical protein